MLVLAGVVACGGDGDPAPTTPGGPGGSTADVTVGDNFFRPSTVTVTRDPAGATIRWTWSGRDQHNVTFDGGGPSSSTQATGTFTRTFTAAGSFTYFCTIHGRAVMSGMVVVQ